METETPGTGIPLSPKERSIASLTLLMLGALVWIGLALGAVILFFRWTGLGDMPVNFQRRVAGGMFILYVIVIPIVNVIARAFMRAARTV